MAGQIQVYTGDTLSSVESWVGKDEAERRRRATEAARDRDPVRLWDLTRTFLVLHGGKGAHLSRHTERAYEAGIRFLCDDWSDVNFLHPDRDRAALWLRTLETRGLSTSTITVRLAAARALYRALRWARVTEADPLSDIRPASDPTPAWEKRWPYEESGFAALLDKAEPIDAALLLLCGHAALRISEALSLTWNDIDLSRRALRVIGKGGGIYTVKMSRTLTATLSAFPHDDLSAYVIPYRTDTWARARLKRLCKQAGVNYLGIHSLRHFAGTKIKRETGSLEDAQHHLRHKNMQTTQRYAKYADDALDNSVGNW